MLLATSHSMIGMSTTQKSTEDSPTNQLLLVTSGNYPKPMGLINLKGKLAEKGHMQALEENEIHYNNHDIKGYLKVDMHLIMGKESHKHPGGHGGERGDILLFSWIIILKI